MHSLKWAWYMIGFFILIHEHWAVTCLKLSVLKSVTVLKCAV